MQLEGLGQLKNPVTSSGIEPATFWLRLKMLKNYFICISYDFETWPLNLRKDYTYMKVATVLNIVLRRIWTCTGRAIGKRKNLPKEELLASSGTNKMN
jgi:hypothetical protein